VSEPAEDGNLVNTDLPAPPDAVSESAATDGGSSPAGSVGGGRGDIPRVPSAPGAMMAPPSAGLVRAGGSAGSAGALAGQGTDPHRSFTAPSPSLSNRTNPPSPVFHAGTAGIPPLTGMAPSAGAAARDAPALPHPSAAPGEPQWEEFEDNRVVATEGAMSMVVDEGIFGVNNAADRNRVQSVRTGISRGSRERITNDGSSNSLMGMNPSAPDSLLIVLYRLPIVAEKKEDGTWDFGWDDDALYLTSTGLRRGLEELKVKPLWVGILPTDLEVSDRDEREAIATRLMAEFRCVPVFLPQATLSKFYQGFCKGTLWPAFHMLTNVRGPDGRTPRFDEDNWHTYQRVNRSFSKVVVAHYDRHLIWVHDYHLMLLPYYLRIKISGVKIGFYLHIPWPSSEIFRMLPVRNELLKGLLSATLLGFHLFDYARHFLSACVRLLNLEHEARRGSLGIDFEGRHVMIRVSHIGVDPARFTERLDSPEWRVKAAELSAKYPKDITLLGAIDDLDVIKGVALKLVAFEYYLASSPASIRDKVALVQVVIPKAARVDNAVREEIRGLVAQINSSYGTETHTPVTYIEEKITFDMRMALYTVCDALVLTPIRDGLNLIPYEYIVATPEGKGQLILSEFTGCSRALSSAVRVNPWNVNELRDVIDNVVQKKESKNAEIGRKHDADHRYVSQHSSTSWAESFLADLNESSEAAREVVRLGLTTGVGFRTLEFEGFTMLNTRDVVKAFRESKNRLFLLDYDGTLTTIGSNMQASMAHSWAVPTDECMESLVRLSSQDNCNVVIVSGRKRAAPGFHQEHVSTLGIAAEHGFYYKAPNAADFEELAPGADLSWLPIAVRIMEMYTERTDGSYVEAKDAGVVWHYLNTDPEFGGWQAKEMHDHLESILSAFNVQVVNGHGWLQVRLANINKGNMVKHVLDGMAEDVQPDFVLCCGDDRTDEDMFACLTRHPKTKDARLFTTTVGVKPSNARYYLRSAYEVQQLIDQLLECADPGSTSHVRSTTLDDLRPAALQRLALESSPTHSTGSMGGLAGSSSFSNLLTPGAPAE
jgi:trehalose 6-phosphate synthase/phosphatase